MYGTIICLSGLFTFAQSGLQALLHHTFEDDPEPINLGLATAGLVLGLALVTYVDIQGRAIQIERAKARGAAGINGAVANGGAGGGGGGPAINGERQPLLLSSSLSKDPRPELPRMLSTVDE